MNNLKERIQTKNLKRSVMSLVEIKNMYSLMDTIKWNELKKALTKLPFPPPYQLKLVTDTDEPDPFDEEFWNLEPWNDEILLPFFNIEWIKFRPRYMKYQSDKLPEKIFDETDIFLELLKKHSIPYEKKDNIFIIYGYKKI
ncbi:DUF6678 family protein [Clostridium cellulovorans]|uniref:Uncharacterized protein n=1 Tax=Clostridium cellulovorans (strain ATCC 35296 / DSM 3052 / OCM 3 / 743B) TaxID=573061 RepID=D9STH5_CLOC7|nr:DUF6678 family protein [Clostridium cellulovorans]ADL52709.1 hypothetical protein Clocel_3019 [Clostridium cellulovorans 743B]